MKMLNFLFRKILASLLTLFLFATLVFFMVQIVMPGDYVSMFMGMSIEEKELLRHELGLDLPIWQQYLRWLGGLLNGQLGRSFTGYPVMAAIGDALPATLLVFLTGGGIAFLVGYRTGKFAGWHRSKKISEGISISVILLYALFPPALAFILGYFLGDRLGWFPSKPALYWELFERDFPDVSSIDVMRTMVLTLTSVILAVVIIRAVLVRLLRVQMPGILSIALILAGWIGSWFALEVGPPALRILHFAALPILAFAILTVGELTIITRTSLSETLFEEYITTARAKGLLETTVRDRHAARNALLPVISKVIVSLPYLIAGLAIIEFSLSWHGLGSEVFISTLGQDVPLILGYLLFIGVVSMGVRLVLEITYFYLDPRIRSGLQEMKQAP